MTETIGNEGEIVEQDGVVADSAPMSDEDKVAVRSYAERCYLVMNESDALTPDVARNMLLLREIESVVTDLCDKMMKFSRIMYSEIFAQYALHNYLVFEKTLLFANDSRVVFTTIDNTGKEPADPKFKIDWSGLGIHIMVAHNYRGLCEWWLSVREENIYCDQFGGINVWSSYVLNIDRDQYAKKKLKSGGALDVFLDFIVKVRDEFIAHLDSLLKRQEELPTEILNEIGDIIFDIRRGLQSPDDVEDALYKLGHSSPRDLEFQSAYALFRRRVLGLKNILASK